MRWRERRICAALKASPSAMRNSRRTTRSWVRVLPLMSMRSTKTRGASFTSKVRSTRRFSRSRWMRGCTSTKGKPRRFTASWSDCDDALHRVAVVPVAFLDLDQAAQARGVEVAEVGDDVHLADAVAGALVER